MPPIYGKHNHLKLVRISVGNIKGFTDVIPTDAPDAVVDAILQVRVNMGKGEISSITAVVVEDIFWIGGILNPLTVLFF